MLSECFNSDSNKLPNNTNIRIYYGRLRRDRKNCSHFPPPVVFIFSSKKDVPYYRWKSKKTILNSQFRKYIFTKHHVHHHGNKQRTLCLRWVVIIWIFNKCPFLLHSHFTVKFEGMKSSQGDRWAITWNCPFNPLFCGDRNEAGTYCNPSLT